MPVATITHATLGQLVQKQAIQTTRVVSQGDGWGVVVHDTISQQAHALAATRSQQTRVFKRLESVVEYLKELGIERFDVDAGNYTPKAKAGSKRPDAAAHLKRAHEAAQQAAQHDTWFRAQVAQALKEADDPATVWLSQDEVKARSAQRRAAWLAAATAATPTAETSAAMEESRALMDARRGRAV
jgi:hypothetical protein